MKKFLTITSFCLIFTSSAYSEPTERRLPFRLDASGSQFEILRDRSIKNKFYLTPVVFSVDNQVFESLSSTQNCESVESYEQIRRANGVLRAQIATYQIDSLKRVKERSQMISGLKIQAADISQKLAVTRSRLEALKPLGSADEIKAAEQALSHLQGDYQRIIDSITSLEGESKKEDEDYKRFEANLQQITNQQTELETLISGPAGTYSLRLKRPIISDSVLKSLGFQGTDIVSLSQVAGIELSPYKTLATATPNEPQDSFPRWTIDPRAPVAAQISSNEISNVYQYDIPSEIFFQKQLSQMEYCSRVKEKLESNKLAYPIQIKWSVLSYFDDVLKTRPFAEFASLRQQVSKEIWDKIAALPTVNDESPTSGIEDLGDPILFPEDGGHLGLTNFAVKFEYQSK